MGSRTVRGWQYFPRKLIQMAALISFFGGPLILANLLKARTGMLVAVLVTILPMVLLILGIGSLIDRMPNQGRRTLHGADRQGVLMVRLGVFGALVTLLMHGLGIWILMASTAGEDDRLNVLGIIVGVLLAVWFVLSARDWLSRVKVPDTSSPIHPS